MRLTRSGRRNPDGGSGSMSFPDPPTNPSLVGAMRPTVRSQPGIAGRTNPEEMP